MPAKHNNEHDFEHGHAYRIAPGVLRVTAPNPGYMTGPGTNTYLVGTSEVAVIDTGVNAPVHLDAIQAAAPGPITRILITHAHPDHSKGARELAQRTGAKVFAHPTRLQGIRDKDFQADEYLNEGDVVHAADFSLRCLHTPGHAADHLCFLREEDGLLFAGDHVMESVTVVIAPPDGDMGDYLAALKRLQNEKIKTIAPAHGGLIPASEQVFAQIIAHRLQREDQVLALLHEQVSRIDDMVAHIYQEVPKALHPVAAWQVYAHLLKLRKDGRAAGEGPDGDWQAL